MRAPGIIGLSLIITLGGCDADESSPPAPTPPTLVEAAPPTAPAGEVLELAVDVTAPDTALVATVERGGGALSDGVGGEVIAGPDGVATVRWTLGVAPIDNTLRLALADDPTQAVSVTVRGALEAPWTSATFGDVNGFLNSEDHYTGSTEDLTFTGDGLLMGAPEGLLHVAPDGAVRRLPVDEGINRVWGFAVDARGDLWGVDAGNSRLVRIGPDGAVEEVLTDDGEQPLEGPNYVAVDHQGRIYLSDPCLGEIIRLDPESGELAVHRFDLMTEGGPNGMAFTADGTQMYTVTENTGVLCGHRDIPIYDEIASVFSIDLDAFGEAHARVTEPLGLFGDGLAFDAEGNLYVIVDKVEGVTITLSAVMVIPAGETEAVTFLAAEEGILYANVAFGQGDYGASTLYIALLSIPPFSAEASRGLERFEVGVPGQPLLP